ncbi:Aste57867_18038 [Aphanomyces stellatus]|uniref:Aste57867_18038 protein n=1 Tax=Aphanomyces stellatus TaxID=120398 RepID=A0A485L9D3_9STRA|nr:hypothetical protein As57867_017976 [Aphanomyces stellatus]VFT94777.1 Aste57867_18038 [Aphanomyces stellatus]
MLPPRGAVRLAYNANCDGEYLTPSCDPYEFYIALGTAVGLICVAGMMAGLTMGLLSIDKLNLQIMQMEGTQTEKDRAGRVLPIVKRHHLLLVTLLLFNAAANEALPVFLARLVPETHAIAISVTCVLLFGEILPSAVFTGKNQLAIAAGLVPFVQVLMVLAFPLAFPMSKMLDWCVGEDHDVTRYKRKEIKALVALQRETRPLPTRGSMASFYVDSDRPSTSPATSPRRRGSAFPPHLYHVLTPQGTHLHTDEVTIIHGALDLTNKTVCDVMVPWSYVYMLDEESHLNRDLLAEILASGHSRIPVYRTHRANVVGLLLVKRLIVLDPSDARPIRELMLKKPIVVTPDFSCYAVLNEFQKGRSHMALITPHVEYVQRCWVAGVDLDPAGVEFDGIVTIEDVVEELIQEEIQDETDRTIVDDAAKRFEAQTRGLRTCAARLRAWAARARHRVQLRRGSGGKRLSIPSVLSPARPPRTKDGTPVQTKRMRSFDASSMSPSQMMTSAASPTWTVTISPPQATTAAATETSPLLPKRS